MEEEKMRKLFLLVLVLAATFSMFVFNAFAGNGAPSGTHYNLTLIGVKDNKGIDMNNNGQQIFVALNGRTDINLAEGTFKVLDANGTDGSAAFQLPNPGPDKDRTTLYSVYARAFGKPGEQSATSNCFFDYQTQAEYCTVYNMFLVRSTDKSNVTDVSRYLLYVYVDYDLDGNLEQFPLFSDQMDQYYWYYDNQGLKLAQLRFYEILTTVP
jgi:hypothetical protein